jgi:hypothetical protein
MTIEEYRQLLGDEHMSDEEIAEFKESLSIYISKYLDNYFKDELSDDDTLQ